MRSIPTLKVGIFGSALAAVTLAGPVLAASPTAQQALKLTPIQKNVDYDTPDSAAAKKCTIRAEKNAGASGWVVRSADGQILRRFSDTNGDNVVDHWSYFKNGLEVYRDIDTDFNGKANHSRWFHISGTRWGIDKDEDGRIDQWQQISAEEVAAEVVAALKSGSSSRFAALLVTDQELKTLGLGETQAEEITKKITSAKSRFSALSSQQKIVSSKTKFINFAGTRPGIVPAGTAGSTKDLLVYENVSALVETSGKHEQISLGTLVRVGDIWRMIDLPQIQAGEAIASAGYFFRTSLTPRAQNPGGANGGISEKMQKLMTDLENIDQQLAQASPSKQSELNGRRFGLLEQLADQSTDSQIRAQWVRQLADTISAASQTGKFSGGVERLQALEKKLSKKTSDKQLYAYVKFRRMTAAYSSDLQKPKADFVKIQDVWLKDLEGFVGAYPRSEDGAEAMLQLAIAQEFAGEDEKSIKWYNRILADHRTSAAAKKARGAKTRLESVGKTISLKGPTIRGKKLDLASYKGKTVLIQYWATWCEPCKADMAQLKELQAKYSKKGFYVLGVNVDSRRQDVVAFLGKNRLPWYHLYEPGGLESRLATEMGILTLPTMILIDKSGRVANRNIHVSELDKELRKLR